MEQNETRPNRISMLEIRYEPEQFGYHYWTIRVRINGQEFGAREDFSTDDMTSFFDRIFDNAKDRLRRIIEEYNKSFDEDYTVPHE